MITTAIIIVGIATIVFKNTHNTMKRLVFILFATISLLACGHNGTDENSVDSIKPQLLSPAEATFFSDSVSLIISTDTPNGYKISILNALSNDMYLWHFQRGDSIDRYIAVHSYPIAAHYDIHFPGVHYCALKIPVLKLDTIDNSVPDNFFMDVNFDGEPEFIVKCPDYNFHCYASYDLVHGRVNKLTGFLEFEPRPYIESSEWYSNTFTVFDYKKKTITVSSQIGCCATEYKIFTFNPKESFDYDKRFRLTYKESHDFMPGNEHVEIYKLKNDTLQLIKKEDIPF